MRNVACETREPLCIFNSFALEVVQLSHERGGTACSYNVGGAEEAGEASCRVTSTQMSVVSVDSVN